MCPSHTGLAARSGGRSGATDQEINLNSREAAENPSAAFWWEKNAGRGSMRSHAVRCTGAGAEVIAALLWRCLRHLVTVENATVTLMSDRQPALVDLLKDVHRSRGDSNTQRQRQLSTVQFMTHVKLASVQMVVFWSSHC